MLGNLKSLLNVFRLRLLHTNGIGFSGNENIKFEIFDKCTSNVCGRCNRQGTCWEGNYKTTYENLYGLVSQWVDKESVDFKNLPNYFIASCSKYREWLLWAKIQ